MRVTLVVPGALAEDASGRTRLQVEPRDATVGGVLEALRESHPALYDRVMTERREVRQHVNVFVGPENTLWTGGLETPVRDGNEVYVLPAVSGG